MTTAAASVGPDVDMTLPEAGARTTRRSGIRRLFSRPSAVVATSFLVVVAGAAALAPWVAPADPNAQALGERFLGPSPGHWLGTDGFGRDVLSRLLFAGRIALVAPLVAVGVAVAIGVPAGLVAGFRRGAIDAVLGRVADTLLSIPPLVMAMTIVAVLGPGLVNAMIAIGMVFGPRLYRVVRGATLTVRGELFIESARSIGSSRTRVLWSHVLPNIAGPLLVQVTLLMGFSLLAEATLSFLGLGVQVPDASWGSMLRDAYRNRFDAPYAVVPPGLALTATILAFNLLGDALRDTVTGRRRS